MEEENIASVGEAVGELEACAAALDDAKAMTEAAENPRGLVAVCKLMAYTIREAAAFLEAAAAATGGDAGDE